LFVPGNVQLRPHVAGCRTRSNAKPTDKDIAALTDCAPATFGSLISKSGDGEHGMRSRILAGLMAFAAVCTQAAAQDAAAIGEEVYEQHCQSCHGEKLRSAGAMPDLRDLGASDRAKFDTMVMDGRGQMPAWQGIVSPLELDQLWAYVRSRAR
jgi:mono/diheme cytochrome c family protein